jgi:hypothetical protein
MLDHEKDCKRIEHGFRRCQRTTQGGITVNYGTVRLNHDTNRHHIDPEDGTIIEEDFASLGDALMALEEHRQRVEYQRFLKARTEYESAKDIVDVVGRPLDWDTSTNAP